MTSADALNRLCGHANLPGGAEDMTSLSAAIWCWQRKGTQLDLRGPLLDVLTCLQVLNAAALVHGPVKFSVPIERDPAYFVSCIVAVLAKGLRRAVPHDQQAMDEISNALALISHAWSQFLAGDIEDLVQDLRDSQLL
jgi:hypothetical protein